VPQTGRSRVRLPMRQMGFCITDSLRLHHSLRFESASNKNEYQQYVLVGKVGRCLKLSILLTSYVGSLEILRSSHSWSPHRLCKLVWVCFIFVLIAKFTGVFSLLFNRQTKSCVPYSISTAKSRYFYITG